MSGNQYGFRKECSTSLAIFNVLKTLHENWNENNFSGCVFVDFSRAFDSIDHTILADKLRLYDDTLLVCKAENAATATEKAQKALDKMLNWCEENKLTMNHTKTKYLLVKHKKVFYEPQLKIGD